MEKEKGKLTEIIKVQINKDIIFRLKSLKDFFYWKEVYPEASIVSYKIQTV